MKDKNDVNIVGDDNIDTLKYNNLRTMSLDGNKLWSTI